MLRYNYLKDSPFYLIFFSNPEGLVSDFNFVIKIGGCGGFFASVLAWGVTGQQQQGSVVSAEDIERGGAFGGERVTGGATNPGSSEPFPDP